MDFTIDEFEAIQHDPDVQKALSIIDNGAAAYRDFLCSISFDTLLKFSKDTVTIFFFGNFSESPIDGILIDKNHSALLPIGQLFTATYAQLTVFAQQYITAVHSDTLDDITRLHWDMQLLHLLIEAADNANDCRPDLLDRADLYVLSDELSPIYGVPSKAENTYMDMMKYAKGNSLNQSSFMLHLQYDDNIDYTYTCKNLYQICGAVLDYCIRHTWHTGNNGSQKYNLRSCKRCKRYFVTTNRKIMYCSYTDNIDGKTCSQMQEIERKKNLVRPEVTPEKQLARKIANRLSSYKNAALNTFDGDEDTVQYRDDIYRLFLAEKDKRIEQPGFDKWLQEAVNHLPHTKNEGYDTFYKWLQGKE